jgi:hypothetical protein
VYGHPVGVHLDAVPRYRRPEPPFGQAENRTGASVKLVMYDRVHRSSKNANRNTFSLELQMRFRM